MICWKPFFVGKRFLRKSTSYGTSDRSAKWKILVHWSFFPYFLQKLDLRDQKTKFYPVVCSQPSFPLKNAFFIWSLLWFISWRTYSLVRRVRHNSKTESKSDLLKSKISQNVIFHEKWLKMNLNLHSLNLKMLLFMRNDWEISAFLGKPEPEPEPP